jgi:CRP/FNR family transcriptional regulator, dissimilatory nitrate respiration regulator
MGSRQVNPLACLGEQTLFRDLGAMELERLAHACQVRRLGRGDELFQANDPCEGLYLVVEGQIKLYAQSGPGHEKVIEVFNAREWVVEAMTFGDSLHAVNAAALCETTLLMLPKAVLLQELSASPALAMRMLTEVSRRLHGLMKDIEAVTLHSGVRRVVDYLLQAPAFAGGEARGSKRGGDLVVERDRTVSLPASKGTIASLLSVTPEHFSRILHELQARGLIAVERRDIHILDADQLARYA